MGKKIRCGPDNVAAFNARLRQEFPEFRALVARMVKHGLVPGLGGCRIEYPPFDDDTAATPVTSAWAGRICAECAHWRRDRVGDGTGIGQCLAGDQRLHWPGVSACRRFQRVE